MTLWTLTTSLTGRRLQHTDSGYYVPLDCLAWRVSRGDWEASEMAVGHVARKPWATREAVAELRAELTRLRLLRREAA